LDADKSHVALDAKHRRPNLQNGMSPVFFCFVDRALLAATAPHSIGIIGASTSLTLKPHEQAIRVV